MTTSSVSNSLNSSILSSLAGSTGSTSGTGNLGQQILAELATSKSSSTSSSALLQELVTLSSNSALVSGDSTQTYNAKGLLNQVEAQLIQNDPLLQTRTDTGTSSDSSLIQNLLAGTGSKASSTSSSIDATTLAALVKQNPSLAALEVQSQIDQSLISTL